MDAQIFKTCARASSVWDCTSAPNTRGHLDQIPTRVKKAFSSNSELQTTEQTQSSKGMSFIFFPLPYLVFRRSSIFLQHLERVNNQEHAAGGPENMAVRQGNGQMLARLPTCRGGQWGLLTPHRDPELPQWFGTPRSWELEGPARSCWAGGASKATLGWGRVQGLAETCHSPRRETGEFSPSLIHQEVSGTILKTNIPVFLKRNKKKRSYNEIRCTILQQRV